MNAPSTQREHCPAFQLNGHILPRTKGKIGPFFKLKGTEQPGKTLHRKPLSWFTLQMLMRTSEPSNCFSLSKVFKIVEKKKKVSLFKRVVLMITIMAKIVHIIERKTTLQEG